MYERAVSWEPDALAAVSHGPPSPHYTPLLNEFTISGKGSSGSHLCFVMPLYGGDVKAMWKSRTTRFPVALAKRIALHLLRGLAHAHDCGVVHTDLKHDNIFFTTSMKTNDIERWLTDNPPRRHPPEVSYDGVIQAAVSQPLPMISEEEAFKATYVLGDFGTGMPISFRISSRSALIQEPQLNLPAFIPIKQSRRPHFELRNLSLVQNGTSQLIYGLLVAS